MIATVSDSRLGRAHRVGVPDAIRSGDEIDAPDYASAFEVTLANADAYSAEQCARRAFEGAPRALRWFVLMGWTTVLRLRLGPRTSTDYVLGWKLAAATPGGPEPGRVTLEVHSSLITARKVVEVERSRVTVTTFVRYERRLGRRIWSALAPVHHLTEPLLLTLAASRRNAGS